MSSSGDSSGADAKFKLSAKTSARLYNQYARSKPSASSVPTTSTSEAPKPASNCNGVHKWVEYENFYGVKDIVCSNAACKYTKTQFDKENPASKTKVKSPYDELMDYYSSSLYQMIHPTNVSNKGPLAPSALVPPLTQPLSAPQASQATKAPPKFKVGDTVIFTHFGVRKTAKVIKVNEAYYADTYLYYLSDGLDRYEDYLTLVQVTP